MLIHSNDLLGLQVVTEGGTALGKVSGFELDIDAHLIRAYEVRRGLVGKKLLVNRAQVVSITKEKMIVRDAVVSNPVMHADTRKNLSYGSVV